MNKKKKWLFIFIIICEIFISSRMMEETPIGDEIIELSNCISDDVMLL